MAAKAVTIKATAGKGFIDFKSILFWVLAIVFVCYANSLTNGYNMDDEIVTINHPLTSKGLSAIPDILKSPYFQSDIYSYEYRPVVHISFAIEHQFLGQSPFVSHLINLLLYLILVVVTFQLLKMLFPLANEMILGAIVLLWALHPTHTEVVCSIKNRDEILALLFAFLAWKEAIKFVQGKQWWRILLVVLLFNLAMGAKVTVVAFILLIPLSSLLLFKRIDYKHIVLSILLGATVTLWIKQSSPKLLIIICGLNSFIFIVFYLFRNRNNFLSMLTVKDSISLYKNIEPLSFEDLFNVFKHNRFLVLVVITYNLIIFYFGFNIVNLLALVIAPILIAAFVNEKERNFWFLFSLILSVEILLVFPSQKIASQAALSIILMTSYFIVEKSFKPTLIIPITLFQIFVIFICCDDWVKLILLLNFFSFRRLHFRWVVLIVSFISVTISIYSNLLNFDAAKLFVILDFILLNGVNFIFYPSAKFKKYTLFFVSLFLVLSVIFIYVIGGSSVNNAKLFSKKIQPLFLQEANVSIVPTQTYRPVLFAEFPLDLNTSPIDVKIGTSAEVLLKYLKLTLLPYPLSFYYGYSELKPTSIKEILPIFSVLLYLILLLLVVLTFKRGILISFGILFYVISIAPFSAFFAPIPGVIADRYLFAPTLGFSFVIVGLIVFLFNNNWTSKISGISTVSKNARYLMLFFMLAYGTLTIARNSDWKDRLTLFQNDIEHVPNSAQAHNLLAYHLNRVAQEQTDPFKRKSMMEDAAAHFKIATEIWPEFMNATYDMGRTEEQLGNWNNAISAYKRTFEIDSSFSDAVFRMGIIYEATNKIDSAIITYKFVTENNPLNITAFNNLSYCYFKKQDYRNAIEIGRMAAFHHPLNTDPMVNIGKTFLHIKENDSALYYFEKVYPSRSDDKGLTEVLYKLWNEKENMEKANFYYRRMQVMGMVK